MATLFQTLLGKQFDRLPREIRDIHDGARRAHGHGSVKRGGSFLARLICRATGVPNDGVDVDVNVNFEAIPNGERWIRSFNETRFYTDLTIAARDGDPMLQERFGPLTFSLNVVADDYGIDMIPKGVSLAGMSLPAMLCPEAIGMIRVRDGRYFFDVSVRAPLAGDVIAYSGMLEPTD